MLPYSFPRRLVQVQPRLSQYYKSRQLLRKDVRQFCTRFTSSVNQSCLPHTSGSPRLSFVPGKRRRCCASCLCRAAARTASGYFDEPISFDGLGMATEITFASTPESFELHTSWEEPILMKFNTMNLITTLSQLSTHSPHLSSFGNR